MPDLPYRQEDLRPWGQLVAETVTRGIEYDEAALNSLQAMLEQELARAKDLQAAAGITEDQSESVPANRHEVAVGNDAWPPARGWAFREGEAAFNGVAFPISGIPAKLLKALARSRRKLATDELCEAGWGDDAPAANTLAKQLGLVKKTLRRHFPEAGDPIQLTRGRPENGVPSLYQLVEKLRN